MLGDYFKALKGYARILLFTLLLWYNNVLASKLTIKLHTRIRHSKH